jgi:leader peptidase (prepilin peptidase) / N-methyltransferase
MSGADSAGPTFTKAQFWAALVAAVISFVTLPVVPAVFSCLLAGLAIWIASVDLEEQIIPDLANAAVAVLGLALIAIEAPVQGWPAEFTDALLRAAVAGGLLYMVRFAFEYFADREGLGLGDVKLMAAGATLLSWASLPYALVLAAIAAISVVLLRSVRQRTRIDRAMEIPFGAFLAPAIWAAFLVDRLSLL